MTLIALKFGKEVESRWGEVAIREFLRRATTTIQTNMKPATVRSEEGLHLVFFTFARGGADFVATSIGNNLSRLLETREMSVEKNPDVLKNYERFCSNAAPDRLICIG